MADDKGQDFKNNFPNSLVWFVLAILFMAMMVQNFIDTRFAKVAFSYQLEPLVNLQLIQPEDSRKTAINDNLVTFSGRFRDRLTDEGKSRYKYLELLNESHVLKAQQDNLSQELSTQKTKIIDSADWYLNLSGTPIPSDGYVVVDSFYSTPEKENSVIITDVAKKNMVTLPQVKKAFDALGASPAKPHLHNSAQLYQTSSLTTALQCSELVMKRSNKN